MCKIIRLLKSTHNLLLKNDEIWPLPYFLGLFRNIVSFKHLEII